MSNADMPTPETNAESLQQCVDWLDHHKQRVHHPVCTYHKPDARCSCGLHKVLTNLRGVISDLSCDEDAVTVTVDMIPSLGFVVYGPGEWRYHKNSHIYLCVWADTLQFGITNCWHVRNPTRGHIRRLFAALEGE